MLQLHSPRIVSAGGFDRDDPGWDVDTAVLQSEVAGVGQLGPDDLGVVLNLIILVQPDQRFTLRNHGRPFSQRRDVVQVALRVAGDTPVVGQAEAQLTVT